MFTGLSSLLDKRPLTKYWPLIATIEAELNDTPRWKWLRRLSLGRQLEEARAMAFSAGIEMALEDLEKAGLVERS